MAAEYAGVLAFGRVGLLGASDPTLYHHPRYEGSLPAVVLVLRQRLLDGNGIRDVQAYRSGIADGIGFPAAGNE